RGVELDALTPLLSTTLSSLTTNGNRFGQVHVLTLTAWQKLRLHHEEAAKEHLDAAVRMAVETGYVGIVQYIPDLKRLLPKTAGYQELLSRSPADTVMLTEQELRVLALLAADRTYRQTAKELTVSLNTVREHVRNLYRKLGVNRRAQAVEAARARGLLPTAPQTQARSMAK
ncbi:MAG: response regulator transcription factor, partial [Caldilineaceae bacterium]|nr:response regulator transcription factor [Caldilineaceae bacterium]